MNITELKTKFLLEHFGLHVEPIDDSKFSNADFICSDSNQRKYIVEVKSKETDKDYYLQLNNKGEAFREDLVGKTNVASRKVHKANKQIQSTLESKNNSILLKQISFVSLQNNSDIDTDQFRATLYGISDLIIPDNEGNAISIPCIYFDYSDFYRYPSIDGVILITNNWAQFCPNPFSEQIDILENSYLCNKFSEQDAMFLPEEMESNGDVLIADCDIDRSNIVALKQYLKDKYQIPIDPVLVKPRQIEHTIRLDSSYFVGNNKN